MAREKSVRICCKNGHPLWNYHTSQKNRITACDENEIYGDKTSAADHELTEEEVIYCSQCEPALAVATLELINGRLHRKLIRTAVRKACG